MREGRFPTSEEIPDHQRLVRRWARDLMGCEHDAEDAAQDVWVEALRRQEHGFTRFSGWMRAVTGTAVTQIVRRDRSRLGRERIVARPEYEPSFVEELERRSVLEFLAREIGRLHEPYRQVVRLRYLEELELDEIARRLNRPPSTIRGQLKRGLDELRTRLEHRAPERAFWGTSFMTWLTAGPPRRVALKSAGALALIAVPVIVATLAWRADERSSVAAREREQVPAADETVGLAGAASSAAQREVVAHEPRLAPAHAEAPPAGGIALSGRVVDPAGTPVPGAAIQILSATPDSEAHTAGFSDADGRFALDGIAPASWIGARPDGLGPSPLHPVEWLERDDIELRVGRPKTGHITLLVRAADGRPVSHAVVEEIFGFNDAPFLGARLIPERHPRGSRGVTDDAGRLVLGKYHSRQPLLLIRSESGPPWFTQQQEARGLDETLAVSLPPAATLTGRALLPDGTPTTDVLVELECMHPLPAVVTRTDEEGRFELRRLPPTDYTLRIHDDTGQRTPSLVLYGAIAAGTRENLELGLTDESTVVGRAVDASGEPLADWIVALEHARGSTARAGQLGTPTAGESVVRHTDAAGRFVFGGLSAERFLVRLYPPGDNRRVPHAIARGVRPGGPAVGLATSLATAPSAYVSGRVLDPDPEATAGMRLRLLSRLLESPYVLDLRADGSFEGGPLPPGAYELEAHTRRLGAWKVARFLISPDEEHVLTPFACPSTGSLRLALSTPAGFHGAVPGIYLVTDSFFLKRQLRTGANFDGREAVLDPLPPGQYNLLVRTNGFGDEYRTVVIRSGNESELSVRLHPGTMREFRIRSPHMLGENARPRVVLHGPGERLQEFTLNQPTWQDPNTLTFGLALVPGEYELEAFFGDELRGEVSFTVGAAGLPAPELEILLRENS